MGNILKYFNCNQDANELSIIDSYYENGLNNKN